LTDDKKDLKIKGKCDVLIEGLKKYGGKLNPTWEFFKRVIE